MSTYTELENLQSEYSDFYKEVYGVRPRFMTDAQWESEEWLEKAIEGLAEQAREEAIAARARQEAAIESFEAQVITNQTLYGSDRVTAIRWMMDAHDMDDVGMFEYRMGLPYSYIENILKEVA